MTLFSDYVVDRREDDVNTIYIVTMEPGLWRSLGKGKKNKRPSVLDVLFHWYTSANALKYLMESLGHKNRAKRPKTVQLTCSR